MALLATRARAKINLSLHVLGRRDDGYHELESLVAFAEEGDELTLDAGEEFSLVVEGPEAGSIGEGADNLVTRAVAALSRRVPGLQSGRFRLVKNLPVASGIGGGSADAAAALRLLAQANGIAADAPVLYEVAGELGADVPVCLDSRTRIMRGTGASLAPPAEIAPLPALLVNPRTPVETPPVFTALGLARGEKRDAGAPVTLPRDASFEATLETLQGQRNDLTQPAISVAPEISEALAALERTRDCALARMSGSGATVFGIFPTQEAAERAAAELAARRPGWWIRATLIGA